MSKPTVAVNRSLVGVIALVCLVAAVVIGVMDDFTNLWCAAFVRVGLVTGALWIALPSRDREAAWANVSPYTLLTVLFGALVFVRRPQVFLPLLAALTVIGLFLRPRSRPRPRTPQDREKP